MNLAKLPGILRPGKFTLRSFRSHSEAAPEPVTQAEEDKWAYNHVERKKGLYKPSHTVEEQIAYMKSKVFENTYHGLAIHKYYRRNVKGQMIMQPPPRMFCVEKDGKFRLNHACPVCRDEYLFFDYRNPSLIEQFLAAGTDQPIDLLKSGLCRDQYTQLLAQLLKAREHGTIEFGVEFRVFDYKQWYENYKEPEGLTDEWESDAVPLARRTTNLETIFPVEEQVLFPAHKRDFNTDWDEWWKRHDKFAKKAK